MIGLLVMLCCMYRYIFTEWSLSRDECLMFCYAVIIEIIIEVIVGFGIVNAIEE